MGEASEIGLPGGPQVTIVRSRTETGERVEAAVAVGPSRARALLTTERPSVAGRDVRVVDAEALLASLEGETD
ncbi:MULTISPECIES: hypothetical protein [Methylobacterium]|uniref:RCK C-terminal domain-containing protein n=1 Tax=Methylobacterium longum TaxID=767694 RepID=A0ABT8AH79_9HYPH|nr:MULTISPECIES: hypothetical protein [Methylobacterium]MCJ2100932.1 hypothetical protein [Methylobacterium sp. E-046]MDN3569154.1 hypothetical protein [Methylobacterium longum]GJE10564.1 hypothetical protein FOHLNKBM_1599 [Methylobacterium longum]